jgi:phenylpyruvate tautomerase
MPLLKLETTVVLTDDKRKALLAALSRTLAETTGKPEGYVMITLSQSAMLMSGKTGNAAFVDVRGIGGLSGDVNRRLSQKVCGLLNESLGVSPDRIYLNFTEIEASNWGWKGNTFG